MHSKENIYIVGHKRPDLDSVASAFGYQVYMNYQGLLNYHAIRCGEANPVTKWVFEKFNTELPQYIPDVSGMNIVLVDHTDPKHRAKGWEKASIVEVIDHHEEELGDIRPKKVNIRLCGSTSSIVAKMIFDTGLNITEDIAGILLCAVIDDTLNLESPTTTAFDIDISYTLANICRIKDTDSLANEIFSKKDIWNEIGEREAIEMDMKEDEIEGRMVVISQIETVNIENIQIEKILEELKRMDTDNLFNLRIVMITDLFKKNCILLVVGSDLEIFENALGKKIVNNTVFLPNVVSRKKQILPIIENMYS